MISALVRLRGAGAVALPASLAAILARSATSADRPALPRPTR
jgi:hypothetical protein